MVHRWEWNSRKCSGIHHFRARILVSDRLNVTEHTPTHLACVSEKSSTPLKNISNRARYFPDRPRVTKVKTTRFPPKKSLLPPPAVRPKNSNPDFLPSGRAPVGAGGTTGRPRGAGLGDHTKTAGQATRGGTKNKYRFQNTILAPGGGPNTWQRLDSNTIQHNNKHRSCPRTLQRSQARRSGQPGHFKIFPDGETIFRRTFKMFPEAQRIFGRRLKCFRATK